MLQAVVDLGFGDAGKGMNGPPVYPFDYHIPQNHRVRGVQDVTHENVPLCPSGCLRSGMTHEIPTTSRYMLTLTGNVVKVTPGGRR